jgi:hypothetical protein
MGAIPRNLFENAAYIKRPYGSQPKRKFGAIAREEIPIWPRLMNPETERKIHCAMQQTVYEHRARKRVPTTFGATPVFDGLSMSVAIFVSPF